MHELLIVAMGLCVFAPFVMSLLSGLLLLGRASWMQELTFYRMCMAGLLLSLVSSVVIGLFRGVGAAPAELDFGHWVIIGDYEIPALFYMDNLAQAFSLMGAGLTALIARFSQTYLHKEAGFGRFFVILGVFASSTQLVAWAGALDLFFAGWEAIGLCSALFIGYFYERDEPVRSGLRAFATYRLCDAGFLIAIVSIHELIGSTRISGLTGASALSESAVTIIAVMLMIAAFGKSAQLPFSTWLPRAMEGPTPASALFYGAVSIHVGLFLLLRISPVLEAAPLARGLGVIGRCCRSAYCHLCISGGAYQHGCQRGACPRNAGADWFDPGRNLPGLYHLRPVSSGYSRPVTDLAIPACPQHPGRHAYFWTSHGRSAGAAGQTFSTGL